MHRVREALNYFAFWILPLPAKQVRVVIFGQGRTGSSVLENLLGSTGYFHRHGELLNTSRGEILFPANYMRGLARRKRDENCIFHVKIYQLNLDRARPVDPAVFLKKLENDGWKIIYLKRRNKVKHALSSILAERRGKFEKRDDRKEKFELRIDCDNLIERVRQRIEFENAEKQALANLEHCNVVYEDDLENSEIQQPTVNRILNYLSLAERKAITDYRKVNNQPLDELISNYEEFVECLRLNNWQSFLD